MPETTTASSQFDGLPDARLAAAEPAPTRFRPRFRALTQAELELNDAIKHKADELAALFGRVGSLRRDLGKPMHVAPVDDLPPPAPARYLASATTKLEEAVMYGIKALTA